MPGPPAPAQIKHWSTTSGTACPRNRSQDGDVIVGRGRFTSAFSSSDVARASRDDLHNAHPPNPRGSEVKQAARCGVVRMDSLALSVFL